MHRAIASFCVVLFAASGCIVPADQKPDVALSSELATRFVHRGITNVDRPVLQPRLAVRLPVENGDQIDLIARGNMDLYDNTGKAWFPDGHAGRFSQIEFIADYQRRFGDVTLKAGVHNYNLPNGLEFLNGERGATSEAFLSASANVLDATPYFQVNWDFDEVGTPYWRGGITESFDLGGAFTLVLDGSLGYATAHQSDWMYGLRQAGWADLRGSAQINYQFDARTQLSAAVHGSRMMDETLRDWFPQIAANGVDTDVIWFSLGVGWAF